VNIREWNFPLLPHRESGVVAMAAQHNENHLKGVACLPFMLPKEGETEMGAKGKYLSELWSCGQSRNKEILANGRNFM
jgi:hypothetical protein